jgi:cyclomaltodextrinase
LRPDIFVVGEVIHGDYARFANDTRLPSITQYELWKAIWSSLNDGNFFELAHALKRHGEFCNHFTPWNFVGNHDTTRIFTQLRDNRYLSHAVAVLLTLPGVPAIYAGDEQGARGNKYHRIGGDAEVRHPPPYRPAEMIGDALTCWQLHRHLLHVRHKRPWIAKSKLRITHVSNRFMSYEVSSASQRLVAAFSIDNNAMRIENVSELVNVAGDADGNLPPHGWAIWANPPSGS